MLYASEGITVPQRRENPRSSDVVCIIWGAVLPSRKPLTFSLLFAESSGSLFPMRILLQRVTCAQVSVGGETIAAIGRGCLLFIAVMQGDTEREAEWLSRKIVSLRLFPSEDGRVNDRTVCDIGGSALVVPQFTLAGDVRKGNRPDYTSAADPVCAERLCAYFSTQLIAVGITDVASGRFGAMMEVSLVNDGPVTLWVTRDT